MKKKFQEIIFLHKIYQQMKIQKNLKDSMKKLKKVNLIILLFRNKRNNYTK